MKKQLLAFIFTIAGLSLAAQTPRMSLLEEFTGETCPPCAATNPGLDIFLKTPAAEAKVIPIKWQVPIPSAPSPTWSLYKTNQTEINWRLNTYPYGVNSAPEVRLDGHSLTFYGVGGNNPDHAANVTNNINLLNTAANYTTPFSIGLTRAWSDNTYSAVTLTVNIQASAAFAAASNSLVCRVVMIEKEIQFATQPGTNGEKVFHWAVRKSFPSIQAGTPMAQNWTNGQTQTFTLNCALPAYIVDKTQVAFVAFIQDDTDTQVWQAAQTSTAAIANDAKAIAVTVPSVVCSGSFVPQATIYNNGDNAITAFTVVPNYDGVAGAPYTWAGNLAIGATTVISFGNVATTNGSHTYSYNITGVSGGDIIVANNKTKKQFLSVTAYDANPVVEGFTVAAFPPPNWGIYNAGSDDKWVKNNVVGYNSVESAKMAFYDIANGEVMDLVLPPLDLGGTQAPYMTFDVAYAQYNANFNDRLEVLVSTDCGATWSSVYDKSGATLATAGARTSAFTPNEGEWRNEEVSLDGFNTTSVLVKFKATSNFGNNLYLDNVNLRQFDPTGIASVQNNGLGVDLFPNPTKGETNLKINANVSSSAKITVVNVLGQIVYTQSASLNAGENTIKIDATEFASGVYNVIIESNSAKIVKKLSVN